ncbi:uncharacterized protein PAC_11566 [Phialocephala subalpina]|uniref:Uncharacterized protein n=1 Tax=Phialocephala subalpina TaxID=576137 RepID=A0A1L7X9G6_9HELO|nr:uncharacterized protein PAC_11566 [Phialocephala subalpina]
MDIYGDENYDNPRPVENTGSIHDREYVANEGQSNQINYYQDDYHKDIGLPNVFQEELALTNLPNPNDNIRNSLDFLGFDREAPEGASDPQRQKRDRLNDSVNNWLQPFREDFQYCMV